MTEIIDGIFVGIRLGGLDANVAVFEGKALMVAIFGRKFGERLATQWS
jgi:hypothetical protein